MIILLPPSEGKDFTAGQGSALQMETLSFPELTSVRNSVLDALIELGDDEGACEILGVGAQKQQEVSFNQRLREAGTKAAKDVYTGVLYEAAHWKQWPVNEASSSVYVTSALWGLVSPSDKILPYRLSMGVKLPELGAVKTLWKTALEPVMDSLAKDQVVIDCRSGPYQAVWPATSRTANRANCVFVPVKVISRNNGVEKIISHYAKHARGEYVGYLVNQNIEISTPQEALNAAWEMAKDADSSIIDARLETTKAQQVLVLVTGTP